MPRSKSQIHLLTKPDLWAEELRLKVDGRPFNLSGSEYVEQVIRDSSPKIIIKKAAQTRFTITFLVRTLHWITERKWHHLYLLPLKTGAIPFVQKRLDPIMDSNPMLETKFKSVDNRTHKQTVDDIALLIRGTNVESELQETPTDVVVFDEYDRMVQDYLADAKHRTDGSLIKRLTYLSTPSVPGHGVDSDDMWHISDQMKWFVKCPGCSRFQTFSFEDNVKLADVAEECRFECQFCSHVWTDRERAEANATGYWEPLNLTEGKFRGYHINQFNSPTMPLISIMEDYYEGQRDARKLKSFYNQSLGEPYSLPGSKVTPEMLDACRLQGYRLGGIPNGAVFIGIDVGHDEIYVVCSHILRGSERGLWNLYHVKDRPGESAWEWLDRNLLSKLSSWTAVCDAHPDKRGAQALAMKYRGRFWMALEKDRPDQEDTAKFDNPNHGEPGKVVIDRTLAFDSEVHQMMNGLFILPPESRMLGYEMPRRDYNAFYHHMIQQVRVEEEDANGRIVARWQKNKNPDHFHHADMFSLVATMRKPLVTVPANVQKAFQTAGNPIAA